MQASLFLHTIYWALCHTGVESHWLRSGKEGVARLSKGKGRGVEAEICGYQFFGKTVSHLGRLRCCQRNRLTELIWPLVVGSRCGIERGLGWIDWKEFTRSVRLPMVRATMGNVENCEARMWLCIFRSTEQIYMTGSSNIKYMNIYTPYLTYLSDVGG